MEKVITRPLERTAVPWGSSPPVRRPKISLHHTSEAHVQNVRRPVVRVIRGESPFQRVLYLTADEPTGIWASDVFARYNDMVMRPEKRGVGSVVIPSDGFRGRASAHRAADAPRPSRGLSLLQGMLRCIRIDGPTDD